MELATTLEERQIQNRIREVGINPDRWYPVAWADRLQPGNTIAVTIWQENIAVYRDRQGQVHALEDACPHKGVALHKGQVQGCNLTCPYHGWEFNGRGECVKIPYFPEGQKLPRANARSYPVLERYNLIWIFPGNPAKASDRQPIEIAEYGDDDWLMIPVGAQFNAHFSMCNENTMDVFHGYLHKELQAWFNPQLLSLEETEDVVAAKYNVSYKGYIAKLMGLTQHAREVTTLPVSIEYRYPHFATSLQGVSAMYLMRLPIGLTESSSFAYFFFRIPLPKALLAPIKPLLCRILQRFVLLRFLRQDIEMLESEQQSYLKNPQRRYVEVNPAIFATQRLIVKQYDRFLREKNGHHESV